MNATRRLATEDLIAVTAKGFAGKLILLITAKFYRDLNTHFFYSTVIPRQLLSLLMAK